MNDDVNTEGDRDYIVTHLEIQHALVAEYGPDLGFEPKLLDVRSRTMHTVREMRQAQMKGDTRAAMLVVDPEFGDDQREYVLERFEDIGDPDGMEDPDAGIREVLGDFFDAGIMSGWSDRLRNEGAWAELPLAVLCGHVLTDPLRDAIEEVGAPYLPRVASHIVFTPNSRAAIRTRKAIRSELEGAPVSICTDRSRNRSVSDLLGPMSADDDDEIIEPGDGSFDKPESLKRL